MEGRDDWDTGRSCVMFGCMKEARDRVRFLHPFPRDELERNFWTNFVDSTPTKWQGPNESTFLCSDHFVPQAYANWTEWKNGRHPYPRLLPRRAPTVLPGEPSTGNVRDSNDTGDDVDDVHSSSAGCQYPAADNGDGDGFFRDSDDSDRDDAANVDASTSPRVPILDASFIKKEPCEDQDSQSTSPSVASFDALPERQAKVSTLVSMMEKREAVLKKQEDLRRKNRFFRGHRRRRNPLYLRQLTPYFKKKQQNALAYKLKAKANRVPLPTQAPLYCLCRSSDMSQFMITCYHCKVGYHGRCVGVEEQAAQFISQYACPPCRDKNPFLTIEYDFPAKREKEGQRSSSRKEQHEDEDMDSSSDSETTSGPDQDGSLVPFSIGWFHNYARPAKEKPHIKEEPEEADQDLQGTVEDLGQAVENLQERLEGHHRKRKRSRKRCNKCVNCAKTKDCGQCRFCLDHPKFGGAGIKKQKCINRRCVMYYETQHSDNVVKMRLLKRCNRCANCATKMDCGECRYCLDKPKFGGEGIMRQMCITRRCVKYYYVTYPKRDQNEPVEEAQMADKLLERRLMEEVRMMRRTRRGRKPKATKKVKKKIRSICKQCGPCLREDDCGECHNCLGKTRFGGTGMSKQKCVMRKCITYSRESRILRRERRLERRERKFVDMGLAFDLDRSPCETSPVKKSIKSISKKTSSVHRMKNDDSTSTMRRKTFSCTTCNAHENKDCRECCYCLDMPKYGGKGRWRQRCMQRRCGPDCPNYVRRKRRSSEVREVKVRRVCRRTNCIQNTQKGSRFCSEACEIRLVTDKIFEFLPSRIESWQRCENVKGQLAADVEDFHLEVRKVQVGVTELDIRCEELGGVLARVRRARKLIRKRDQEEGEDHAEEVEKTTVVRESNLSKFMRSSGRNDETVEVVDYSWGLQKLESKKRKLACGCPLVANFFKKTNHYCPLPKDKCPDHQNWEELIKAEMELERVRGWLRVNRLLERQQELEETICQGQS